MDINKTILIIDDSALDVQIMFSIVQNICNVIYARSLEDGLSLILKRTPDLILLDNYLKDGMGLDFCKLLRSNPITAKIKVIMITSEASAELEAFEVGVNDFMSKPVTAKIVEARIRNQLGI